jgi:hypothetical protein
MANGETISTIVPADALRIAQQANPLIHLDTADTARAVAGVLRRIAADRAWASSGGMVITAADRSAEFHLFEVLAAALDFNVERAATGRG